MRELILVLILSVLLGCGANVWGVQVAVFDASVGTDCFNGECEKEVKANGLNVPGAEFAKYLLDTIISVAGKFVPGGLKPNRPEALDVRLIESED